MKAVSYQLSAVRAAYMWNRKPRVGDVLGLRLDPLSCYKLLSIRPFCVRHG